VYLDEVDIFMAVQFVVLVNSRVCFVYRSIIMRFCLICVLNLIAEWIV